MKLNIKITKKKSNSHGWSRGIYEWSGRRGRGPGNFENGHGWSRRGGEGGPRFFLWSRSLWTAPNMSKTFSAWGGQKIYKNHWGLWVFFKPLQYSHFGKAFQFAG